MEKTYRFLLTVALLLAPSFFLLAGSYDQLDQILRSPQPLQTGDLTRTSLLVSGVEQDRLASYSSEVEKYLLQLQSSLSPSGKTEYALGQSLLSYLHATRLKRYDSSQASVRTLLDKGKFNCISSTLLYLICARSLGLTVEGIRTTRHVFCRMKLGETWVDVETTTKYGFDPGTREEFFDEFGRVTGFRYIPPKNYRYRQSINDVDLLSLIVQSRLTSEDEQKDPRTLRFAMEWYARTASEADSKELVYAWSKYVQWLNRKELYDDAVAFVNYYKTRFGSTPFLQQSVQTMVHNQIVLFIEKKHFDVAEQLLYESAGVLSLDSTRVLAEYLVSKAMKEATRRKSFDHALELTARLVSNGYLEEPVSQKYSQYLQAKKQYESARRK
ncbi:MAG TPA: hypothetical protein VJ521_16270 [Acidobacteriota bacterium]|nr:hypothetical protein [Acidobacteriota bacterium]